MLQNEQSTCRTARVRVMSVNSFRNIEILSEIMAENIVGHNRADKMQIKGAVNELEMKLINENIV